MLYQVILSVLLFSIQSVNAAFSPTQEPMKDNFLGCVDIGTSSILVSPRLVVTAAHNIHNKDAKKTLKENFPFFLNGPNSFQRNLAPHEYHRSASLLLEERRWKGRYTAFSDPDQLDLAQRGLPRTAPSSS